MNSWVFQLFKISEYIVEDWTKSTISKFSLVNYYILCRCHSHSLIYRWIITVITIWKEKNLNTKNTRSIMVDPHVVHAMYTTKWVIRDFHQKSWKPIFSKPNKHPNKQQK